MQVFISHVARDAETARRLAESLRAQGLEPWSSEMALLPGGNWAKELGEELEKSDAMVVLLSSEALSSAWVKREIGYALGQPRFEGRLLPVSIGPKELLPWQDIPWVLNLASFQWLTLEPGHEPEVARRIASALKQAA